MATDEKTFQEIAQAIADVDKPAAVPAVARDAPVLLYSPETMVQLMVEHPEWSHAQFAFAFGRKATWFSQVLASEAFQKVLDGRRHEIADPELASTLEERFTALTIRSLAVLNEKLDAGKALPDSTVLGAISLGTKALGMGLRGKEKDNVPEDAMNSSERVANKIMEAMERRKQNAANAQAVDVVAREVPSGE